MLDKESPTWTIAFSAGVALVCSLMVATAVYWLRPIQAASGSIEYDRFVLEAADLIAADTQLTDREVLGRFLELDTRIVDLQTGRYTSAVDRLTYDYREAASLDGKPRYMPVYLIESNGRTDRLVLPVYGRGMWSTIHALLTLAPDLRTIEGVLFYEHGETPGIGDRIENAAWRAQWQGKQLFTATGALCFQIGGSGNDACRVDGITGATVTATAVERMIRDWLGDDGYGPYLRAQAQGLAP